MMMLCGEMWGQQIKERVAMVYTPVDKLSLEKCLTPMCNTTSQYCCLYVDEDNEDNNLAWCCEDKDGCGNMPWSCGKNNSVVPSTRNGDRRLLR